MLGWGLRRLERYEDAKNAFLEALKHGADENSDTYNELSLCYIQEKNFEESKKCLLKALQIDPESTKVISNLGYLSLAMGNKDEARRYFTTVLELEPNDKIAANELMKLESEM
jgi:tetratricopeptide (TPR) repeat protein